MNELASADITLKVGELTWDSIMNSSYGSDGGFGELMRPLLARAEPVKLALGHGRIVRAMPDMWDDLAHWLSERAHHGAGVEAAERRRARMWAQLGRRVNHEILKLAVHPAYKGVGILGVDRTVFSAWQVPDPERFYPTARMALSCGGLKQGCEHGVLVPAVVVVRTVSVTQWTFVPTNVQTDWPPRADPS